MAISGTTTAKNRILRSVAPKSVFDSAKALVDSTISFNQGDLLYLDTTAHLIKKVAATGNAATIIGIAKVTVSSGDLKSPYTTAVDAAQAVGDIPGPEFGSVALLIAKTGDAFNPGDKVYLADGTSAQTVSSTDPGDHYYVGIYQGAVVASAAAGQEIAVLLVSQYPAALL